jgi:hypothetical protein
MWWRAIFSPKTAFVPITSALFFCCQDVKFCQKRNTDLDQAGMFEMIPDPLLNILPLCNFSHIQGIPCTKFTILSKIGPFLRRAFCPALASTTLPENFLGGSSPWKALTTDWVHKCCITVFGVLFCKDICSSWECFSVQAHSRSSIHKTNAS